MQGVQSDDENDFGVAAHTSSDAVEVDDPVLEEENLDEEGEGEMEQDEEEEPEVVTPEQLKQQLLAAARDGTVCHLMPRSLDICATAHLGPGPTESHRSRRC